MADEETKEEAKQTGAKINTTLYTRLRAQAILEGRQVGELIDDAIRGYFATIEGDAKRTKPPRPKRGGA